MITTTTILTYKLLHDMDFSQELEKARKVAEYVVKNKTFSSKNVRHIGLKSMIANQILRKYGRNKVIKQVRNIKLVIPGQGIKLNSWSKTITIPCLNKYSFQYHFPPKFEKINQIEIGDKYLYVSVSIREKEMLFTHKYLEVDLNTTGHVAVVSNPNTGKVWKLGKIAEHIHTKYKILGKGFKNKVGTKKSSR